MSEEAKTFTADEVREMLREACQGRGGQSAWARAHNVTAAYVSMVLSAAAKPGRAIAHGLGLREIPPEPTEWRWALDNDKKSD